ncbi:hypothetical protein GCM10011386_12740 [Parapedobacter defluvii]|uniref:Uncharacterized protein n=1 Tax=Parapedobacter defluvii TaxID=2045106 RepID=A0ABQ1LBP0_9SPHI|nr:hypothetical protein [Parapedobacter defluvii]GGC22249.1 hypothetical protein GCM10011386_12740 [Parapedobacter defluvii]
MKNVHRPTATFSALLLIGSGLFVWTAVLLARFWYAEFATRYTDNVVSIKIGQAIASVIFLSIVCALLLTSLWLVSVVSGWRPSISYPPIVGEAYRGADKLIGLRGKDSIGFHLLLAGCLGSFWIFFLQDSLWITISWSLLLPALAAVVPYTPESRYYPRMLLCCCVLMMMAGMKAQVLYGGSLLYFFSAFWLSMLITLPAVLTIVWIKVSTTGERHWHWRLLLSLPVGCFIAFFYAGPILAFFNVHLDPQQTSRVYPAVVTQKCAPHEAPLLRVEVIYEGKKAEHLIDFRPEVFENSVDGDTVDVRIYNGYFGWPWFKAAQDEPLRH